MSKTPSKTESPNPHQEAILNVLKQASIDMGKLSKPPEWCFDPQLAVDLLFAKKEEEFQFQRAIYLYLFLIWCVKPGSNDKPTNMRSTAASAALRLTFSTTVKPSNAKHRTLNGKHFGGCDELQKRTNMPWYQEVDQRFIKPVGGLRNAINAPSAPSEDWLRRDVFRNRCRELAIVDCMAKILNSDARLATRATVQRAIQFDVLCKGLEFYKTTGAKRKARQEQLMRSNDLVPVIGESTVEQLWDDAPRSIVLLYALQPIIGAHHNRFLSDPLILQKLDNASDMLRELKNALRLYITIIAEFAKAVGENSRAAQKWRLVNVPSATSVTLPKFTAEQKKRFEALRAKHLPRKSLGTQTSSSA